MTQLLMQLRQMEPHTISTSFVSVGPMMLTQLVINVLLDTILKKERFPPVLYLQLDNTARENKNQFVMAFLSYLVQVGVFKEVIHIYLHIELTTLDDRVTTKTDCGE